MGHVQVAAENDRFLAIESLQIAAEIILPCHPIVQSLQTILRIGRVAAHQEEIVHLKRYHAPFMVVFILANAVGHAEWIVLGKDGRAAIAFLVGIVPITLVAFEGQIELSRLHLRLLKTEEVGIQLLEYLAEALALAGTQAVHIPTNESH